MIFPNYQEEYYVDWFIYEANELVPNWTDFVFASEEWIGLLLGLGLVCT